MPCNSTGQLWACPPNNSSVAAVRDGKPVVVEQGPKWLVELAYAGPEWLPMLLNIVMLAVVAAAIVAMLLREPTPEQIMEVVQNGLLVASVLVLSYVARDVLPLSYLGDVAVGGIGGFALSTIVFRQVEDRIREQVEQAVETSEPAAS